MLESFLNDRIALHIGDCRDVLAELPENSFDSCATDPPYHLVSIVKRFGAANSAPVRVGDINATNDLKAAYARQSAGFMGKAWDGGDIAFDPDTWRAVLRVLKPGAHAVVFTIPKHIGLVQVAMQEAGFEFRDVIVWAFGSGFPKSHDVSRAIDNSLGKNRSIVANSADRRGDGSVIGLGHSGLLRDTNPATLFSDAWDGWGTALKPSAEFVILARKPLSEKTVAANVLRWGTGAINIDGCRVETAESTERPSGINGAIYGADNRQGMIRGGTSGRWPANLIHDGSEEVTACFPETASGARPDQTINASHWGNSGGGLAGQAYEADSGSAARFFYTAKADADDRIGSTHPTIKPLDLMQYLCRLITPPRGCVLDPFAGSGTTGEAAWREGFSAVLIEREAEYCADIRRRMALALSGPDERARESIKAKNLPRDDGPLFSGIAEAAE